MTSDSAPKKTWRDTFAAYAHPRVRAIFFLGFSTGLALPMVLMTQYARLRQAGLDRTTIGLFGLLGLMYSLKFFWSPFVDRLRLPLLGGLGRRRSWLLLSQLGVALGLVAMALHDPATGVGQMALLAALTAFAAATQDIVVDAYRIEAVGAELQGSMVASWQIGYQAALICSQAGALTAAAAFGWTASYLVIAACLGVGVITTLVIDEPEAAAGEAARVDAKLLAAAEARLTPARVLLGWLGAAGLFAGAAYYVGTAELPLASWLGGMVALGLILALASALAAMRLVPALRGAYDWTVASVILPLVDFFARYGLRLGLIVVALIVTYRLNYMTMGMAANTFYLDLGFSLNEIAAVSKTFGLVVTMTGGVVGGVLVARYGLLNSLLVGFALLTTGNLFYAYIAQTHPDVWWLAAAVSIDNMGNGIAGVAFIAYMSSLVNRAYTATQFALFGMLWSLPAKLIASQWGRIVDAFGYRPFFVYTALIGLPSLLLVLWLMRRPPAPTPAAASSART